MCVLESVEGLVNRRYFADTRYLALVCDRDTRADRLRARGLPWTDDGEGDYWADVDRQVEFNEWFRTAAPAGLDRVDTTDQSVNETATAVVAWLSEHLGLSDGALSYSSR